MQKKKYLHHWKNFNSAFINNLKDLLEEGVAVNELLLMLVLQLVGLDVLPERRNDHRPVENCVGCISGARFFFLNFCTNK